ncbi:MAG: sugar porter family MFS transporter [Candidatus Omnitrophica bacterium]|nr:sugar porter family MFS transporter [Candidatus Omnitrophota bacterium]
MIIAAQPELADVKTRYNVPYIWTISLVAALGGLLFGYDWVVIGGAKPFFERFFQLTDAAQKGWANSCALIGCLFGALMAGGLSDRFGRKRLLVLAALLFAVTSLGNGLASSFAIFVFWRMLGGVAIGLASNLSPMYIAEIAPAELRGRLVAINQLTIVLGILAAQFINYCIADQMPARATEEFIRSSWNCRLGWRWMFGVTAIPSMFFFIGMFLVPESPRWLVKSGRSNQARGILARIGGDSYAGQAIARIEATLVNEIQKVHFRDLLEPKMKKVLFLGIALAVFQQWCGINVIFNYAEEIFSAAGYDISETLKNIAWTGSVNLVFTFVALGYVDRKGRRPLMLLGAGGLALIYCVMGWCYHSGIKGWPMLFLVLAAIGCYAMSLAPVTWVVISEIFPNRIRGAAMSIAVMALWFACFVLTYTFPILNKGMGTPETGLGKSIVEVAPFLRNGLGPARIFWLYAAICVAGFLLILVRLPETKGKTLEEIEKELVD